MDFFKIKRFVRIRKAAEKDEGEGLEVDQDATNSASKELKGKNLDQTPTVQMSGSDEIEEEEEEDDDDDFITNEVKRRLKELRKNSFMVLIPEEECVEEEEEDGEEEEGSSSREWIESEVGVGLPWCGFDVLYNKYCERMLFFDRMSTQLLRDAGSFDISKRSPRSASRLASTFRNLSFTRRGGPQEDSEQLQQQQEQLQYQDDPYEKLETAYVAQVSLSWEALHCQYMQLSLIIASQPENPTSYSRAAQAFQQFQVLLQRFIENEPFERGSRVEVYARSRSAFSKLLQVPTFQVVDQREETEEGMDQSILAADLRKVLEESILTFRLFLKEDKRKKGNLLGNHNQTGSSLQQVQASLDKKEVKVKELFKKKKGWKSKAWPTTLEEMQLLFALIDIKVVSRVLRMAKLSKEQLLWCEEKMSKLDLSDNRLRRDGSPILFPC